MKVLFRSFMKGLTLSFESPVSMEDLREDGVTGKNKTGKRLDRVVVFEVKRYCQNKEILSK